MQRLCKTLCALLFGAVATSATAENYAVERSLPIPSASEDVWNMIGDFCDIDDWHPAVTTCVLKVIDGSLHRVLTLTNGSEFVEKRIAVEPGLSLYLQHRQFALTGRAIHGDVFDFPWPCRCGDVVRTLQIRRPGNGSHFCRDLRGWSRSDRGALAEIIRSVQLARHLSP